MAIYYTQMAKKKEKKKDVEYKKRNSTKWILFYFVLFVCISFIYFSFIYCVTVVVTGFTAVCSVTK